MRAFVLPRDVRVERLRLRALLLYWWLLPPLAARGSPSPRDADAPKAETYKIGWSGESATQQRQLLVILAEYPTTAGSTQFCLLCCQPEPVPGLLAARMPRLTPWDPCRLPAWLGSAIHMSRSAYWLLRHSSTLAS